MNIKDLEFTKLPHSDDDRLYSAICERGRFTVLERVTGFGWRDIETGYKDLDGKFWLASGGIDIRQKPDMTIEEAIDWLKTQANSCIGA